MGRGTADVDRSRGHDALKTLIIIVTERNLSHAVFVERNEQSEYHQVQSSGLVDGRRNWAGYVTVTLMIKFIRQMTAVEYKIYTKEKE